MSEFDGILEPIAPEAGLICATGLAVPVPRIDLFRISVVLWASRVSGRSVRQTVLGLER